MSIHKLERVLWRVRKNNPNKDTPPWLELTRAIMFEIGTDRLTISKNIQALKALGWIKIYKGKRIRLTNKDLE